MTIMGLRAPPDITRARRRHRILFIGEAITLSHVARPSVLANTLDPERHEILFACDEGRMSLLERSDAIHWIPLRSRMAKKDLDSVIQFKEEFYDLPTLDHYVREDLALFRRYRPDVVVGDMRLSLITSARLMSVPYINIQSSYWHPLAPANLKVPVNPLSAAVSDEIVSLVVNVFAPISTINYNVVSLKYGVKPPGLDFRQILSFGDYVVFPDIPEWSPLSCEPVNASYVGPLLWSPHVAPPEWWHELEREGERPTIYVGLGSSGQPRLLRAIVDVAAGLGFRVIVSTASRAELDDAPEAARVTGYIDGKQAAGRSVLTICNGGSTSAPQALSVGCPVLGITSNMDQAAFMDRLSRTGAAMELPESKFSTEALRATILEMTRDDRHRRAAAELKTAMDRFDTKSAFERVLQAALTRSPNIPRASAPARTRVAAAPE